MALPALAMRDANYFRREAAHADFQQHLTFSHGSASNVCVGVRGLRSRAYMIMDRGNREGALCAIVMRWWPRRSAAELGNL